MHEGSIDMATSKDDASRPLPPEDQPRPGPLPTEGDTVRGVGKRAHDDATGANKDTDQSGYQGQRDKAPEQSPTKRSGVTDGSKS
jgi:hypothetical protein